LPLQKTAAFGRLFLIPSLRAAKLRGNPIIINWIASALRASQ